jgi:phenylalanyl-tRNA synthetase beta subunit
LRCTREYRYCTTPFEVEQVAVTDALGTTKMYPNLESRAISVPVEYINKYIGISLEAEKMADLLTRMQLASTVCDDGTV